MNTIVVVLEFLNKNQGLMTFLSTVLWGIYVYLTRETFIQIKRQTDLQMDASLLIEGQMSDNESMIVRCPAESAQLHAKWCQIIKRLPQSNEMPERRQSIELNLRNRGHSDIIRWEIKVKIQVDPNSILQEEYNTGAEIMEWRIVSQGSRDYICAGENIRIPIAITGMYPKAHFWWTVCYQDSRGKSYKQFAGDNEKIDENLLVNLRKSHVI